MHKIKYHRVFLLFQFNRVIFWLEICSMPEASSSNFSFDARKEELNQKYKEELNKKYKERGFQKMSLAEYQALQAKKSKKFRFSLPTHFKIVLSTPFLIIFCCGVLIIPYGIYLIMTGKPADNIYTGKKDDKNDFSFDDLMVKDAAKKTPKISKK